MRKIFFVFIFGVLLWGCGSSQEEVLENKKLDNLDTVSGRSGYRYASDLECKITTATDPSKEGEVFHLKGLDSPINTISFAQDDFRPIVMERAGMGVQFRGFVIISTLYGQSYLLFDVETGVFSLSSLDIIETLDKNTYRGNCGALLGS